jgi:hypothetical protein
MPDNEGLAVAQKRIKDLTARVGRLKREAAALTPDDPTVAVKVAELTAARKSREELAIETAKRFDIWMLINTEGRTEFVAREEWATRMALWMVGQDLAAFRAMGANPPEQVEREAIARAKAIYLRQAAALRGEVAAPSPDGGQEPETGPEETGTPGPDGDPAGGV